MTAETDRMLAEALTKLSPEDRAKYDEDMAAYGRAGGGDYPSILTVRLVDCIGWIDADELAADALLAARHLSQ